MLARHDTGSDAHVVRMARVNITVPDDLLASARGHGLNISEITRLGLETQLRRIENADGLAQLQAEMEADLGPPSPEDLAEAEAWRHGRSAPTPRENGPARRARQRGLEPARDVRTNRILRHCDVVSVDADLARNAARLRTRAAGHTASAVDATVIAVAAELPGCTVLTTDLGGLAPMAAVASPPVRVAAV
mgnify:CR=1 FL=1